MVCHFLAQGILCLAAHILGVFCVGGVLACVVSQFNPAMSVCVITLLRALMTAE